MGEPRQVFNLLSAPAISANARFNAVPVDFQGEDITHTVLGNVAVAFCDSNGGSLQLHFDISSGNISVPDNCEEWADPSSAGQHHVCQASVGARLRAAGMRLVHECYVCDIRYMSCTWEQAEADVMPLAKPELPRILTGHSRIKLRTAHAQLDIIRHAMVRLSRGSSMTAIDCHRFKLWRNALAACEALLKGSAPKEDREEWTLMFATSMLNRSDFFYFAQVEIPFIVHAQADVHGLLGQRSVSVSQHTQQPALGRTIQSSMRWGAQTGHSENTANDTDPPKGYVHDAQTNNQGEGCISGHYSEYIVPSLADHHGFRFSRFACVP